MSPFMALICLAVIVGIVLLLIGLVLRKRVLIYIGAPAGFLFAVWFFVIGLAPNPETEFAQLFGSSNRSAAYDIRTIKPRFMDGHFLSFRMSRADFDSRIRMQFTMKDARPIDVSFLHGQAVPKGWPEWIMSASDILTKEVEHQQVALIYDAHEQTAYVSVEYEQW